MNSLLLALTLAALPPAQIHATGPLHGNETIARDGERWLALVIAGPSARLEPVVIHVEPVEDPYLDADGERSGRAVRTPGMPATPALLLAGADLRRGAVDVAIADRDLTYLLGEDGLWQAPLSLHLPGDQPTELALDCSDPSDAPLDAICTLWLQRGDHRQPLMQYPRGEGEYGHPLLGNDAQPQLLFAGDLDRDGQLDLILDLGHHYNVSNRVLLLSGAARDGELVREVAHHRTSGC
jgi:hypothetical protein